MSRRMAARACGRSFLTAAFCASLCWVTGCEVGVAAEYPDDYYGEYGYPPDAYIATTAPVYYDGYPTYWYNGGWYYRAGGRWNHFDREPPALYDRRVHAPPARRNYEPAFGRARGGFSGGHVGGSGGGHFGGGAHGGHR